MTNFFVHNNKHQIVYQSSYYLPEDFKILNIHKYKVFYEEGIGLSEGIDVYRDVKDILFDDKLSDLEKNFMLSKQCLDGISHTKTIFKKFPAVNIFGSVYVDIVEQLIVIFSDRKLVLSECVGEVNVRGLKTDCLIGLKINSQADLFGAKIRDELGAAQVGQIAQDCVISNNRGLVPIKPHSISSVDKPLSIQTPGKSFIEGFNGTVVEYTRKPGVFRPPLEIQYDIEYRSLLLLNTGDHRLKKVKITILGKKHAMHKFLGCKNDRNRNAKISYDVGDIDVNGKYSRTVVYDSSGYELRPYLIQVYFEIPFYEPTALDIVCVKADKHTLKDVFVSKLCKVATYEYRI